MDASAIPNLARDTLQVLRDAFVGVMTVLERRGLGKQVIKLSDLFFHAGGMHQALQKIAAGKGTMGDIDVLKHQLNETEAEVQEIVEMLNDGARKLYNLPDGLDVANEIGNVIYSPVGKMGIRENITAIIHSDPKDPATIQAAKNICEDIENFNKRLIDLHKRVLKPAAETFAPKRA